MNEKLQNILSAINQPDIPSAAASLDQLLKTASVHCVEPFQVALVGPVNVGKSSLFNALIGFERTIVTDVPGTTRDLVSGKTAFQGWPVLLTDTAGIRETDDRIEQLGINLSQSVINQVNLVLNVIDVSEKNTRLCNQDKSTITVYNKTDLSGMKDFQNGENLFYVSAKTGFGLEQLIGGISKRLVPHPPRIGDPVLFTKDQVETVRKIKTSLETGNVFDAIMLLEQMLR